MVSRETGPRGRLTPRHGGNPMSVNLGSNNSRREPPLQRSVTPIRRGEDKTRGEDIPSSQLDTDSPELLERYRRQFQSDGTTVMGGDQDSTHVTPTDDELIFSVSQFGQFQFHARGGLGEVFVAGDQELNRQVALKFIRRAFQEDEATNRQFRTEAEVTAQLEHPGVAPIYGFGSTSDGRPFHVMRFIRGDTLRVAIDQFHAADRHDDSSERRAAFRNLLARFVSVCNTIAYAHNRGILHRDIKPENVMLGKYGETLVVDWGLALSIDRDERARASGEQTLQAGSGDTHNLTPGGLAGTPAYMSPEQAAGDAPLGPSSDIYGLGALLYKLLTGAAPFHGERVGEVLDKVERGAFPSPRAVRSDVPRAIEAICLKAMSTAPRDRYATAIELAEDVENYLAGEPVMAHQENWGERLARWASRHRSWAGALAVTLLTVIAAATLAAVMMARLARGEHQARVTAEQASEDGNRVAARFAAKTVAAEIDLRWRILEAAAADEQIRSLLLELESEAKSNGDSPSVFPANPSAFEAHDKLQNWLQDQRDEHQAAAKATSWFVTNAKGVQVSRRPTADTIGGNFAFRDYFHGGGRDLTQQDPIAPTPIQQPHRSIVFKSKVRGKLITAFSTPIWSDRLGTPGRRVLGVLAMTVELGQFGVLDIGLGTDQMAVLVDTKPDWQGRPGLILHHPRMRRQSETRLYRIPAECVAAFAKLRAHRLKADPTTPAHTIAPTDIDRHYIDPVDDSRQGEWLASFEPVLVKGRGARLKDTGWVVVVQKR